MIKKDDNVCEKESLLYKVMDNLASDLPTREDQDEIENHIKKCEYCKKIVDKQESRKKIVDEHYGRCIDDSRNYRYLLSLRFDNEIHEDDEKDLLEHLEKCPSCRKHPYNTIGQGNIITMDEKMPRRYYRWVTQSAAALVLIGLTIMATLWINKSIVSSNIKGLSFETSEIESFEKAVAESFGESSISSKERDELKKFAENLKKLDKGKLSTTEKKELRHTIEQIKDRYRKHENAKELGNIIIRLKNFEEQCK